MSGYLGHVLWYTISTGSESKTLVATREDLERWFGELDLDKAFIPKSTRADDAFRAATSGVGAEYTSDDGLRYQLVVEETVFQPDLVKRHVLRQAQVDGGPTRRVADMTFFRPRRRNSGRIHGSEDVKVRLHAGLTGPDREHVQEFVDGRLRQYENSRRQLTPHRVRVTLRAYLSYLGGVPLRPGLGVYFVPEEAMPTVRDLATFVSRCGEQCQLIVIPLVDGEEQRELIRVAIDVDVDERARKTLEMINDWRERNPERQPTRGLLRSWVQWCRTLQELVLRYGQRFNMTFPTAADSLEDLHTATEEFAQRFVASNLRPSPRS